MTVRPVCCPTSRHVRLKYPAIAGYPMYRGVSRLVGMDVLESGDTLDEELETLETHWDDYDFFYLHVKKIDSAGEDGDFDRKASLIEEVDKKIPPKASFGPVVMTRKS